MDKDKNTDNHAPSTWMEMHQYLSELLTPGNSSRDQADVLSSAWAMGVVGGGGVGVGGNGGSGSSLGFKATPLEPLHHHPPHAQGKTDAEPSRQSQQQRKGEARERREDVHHACVCPGCPYSTPSFSFETLKSRHALSSAANLDPTCHPKDLSTSAPMGQSICLPDTTDQSGGTSHLEARQSGRLQGEEADRGSQSPQQDSESQPPRASSSSSSLSSLPVFPCLCCHRSLQACSQLLSNQTDGSDTPFSHTHAHHHFHHHHCPLTSCFPCPQLAHSHSSQLTGPFPCFPCQRSFPTCSQVFRHQHRAGGQQREERVKGSTTSLLALHMCMHCPASFSRPSQLLQHQRSEHANKQSGFICTECGRAFNSHSNLRIHLNVHTGARPYTCSDCGKSFSQSGALKIHRRIHTGERPYSCGFCGRGFPHLAGVRAHQRTHTGEKPYRCNQCGKCFTQSGALKIHTRIHTGERPFVCSICGKSFSNRSGIRFHYRTVHGLTPEQSGETGVGQRGSAGRSYPRAFPSTSAGRDGPSRMVGGPHRPAASSESDESTAADPRNGGSNREGLLYACEDCGLRFKDAPSRNRHQTMVHYSSEVGREEGVGEEVAVKLK